MFLFHNYKKQLLNQAIRGFKNVLGEDIRDGKVGSGGGVKRTLGCYILKLFHCQFDRRFKI